MTRKDADEKAKKGYQNNQNKLQIDAPKIQGAKDTK